jgi:hypothetical protein
MAHTKSPWRIDIHVGHQEIETRNIVTVNGGRAVATIVRFNPYEVPKDEQEANAKLIAAAPDLLKACLKVINGGYGCAPSVEYMDSIKKECEQAIKKATE